jgi:hypothetical protein
MVGRSASKITVGAICQSSSTRTRSLEAPCWEPVAATTRSVEPSGMIICSRPYDQNGFPPCFSRSGARVRNIAEERSSLFATSMTL